MYQIPQRSSHDEFQESHLIRRKFESIMFSSSSSNPSSTTVASIHHVSPFQPFIPISSSNYNHPPPPPPPPCAHQDSVTGDFFPHHFHDLHHLFSTQFPLHNNNNAPTAAPPPHHHQTLISHLGASSNTVPPSINASFSGEDHHQYFHHSLYGNINNSNFPYLQLHSSSSKEEDLAVPVTVKKDRHSKIFTAQGLRDRRVRLSINVARQFFDLQDLLGFDKASKTLDWLLTKSRKAIKQLRPHTRHLSTSTSTSTSSGRYSKSSCSGGSEVEVEPGAAAVDNHMVAAKETRAKARARARERTKEKLMLNKVQLKVGNASEVNHHQELGSLLADVNKGNKLKQTSPLSYSNNNYNSPQNWDINGAFPCPSLNGI